MESLAALRGSVAKMMVAVTKVADTLVVMVEVVAVAAIATNVARMVTLLVNTSGGH